MTNASARLASALTVWPLDREQQVFVQEATAGIDEDQAFALLELLQEAETEIINFAYFLSDDTQSKSQEQIQKKSRPRGGVKFRPLHDRVVVKCIDAEKETVGGIIIPDTAKEKPSQGEIVAVGPGGRDLDGKLIPIDLKVGDTVLFGKWSGTEVKIDGQEFLIMKESDILGIVEFEIRRRVAKGAA